MHVVATAGHVDHGKSTLVRVLTGMEPDRWADEQRRGMTIDLGFAWTTLPDIGPVAFVDVPGHERFVTNMLAGVGAAPAVMLVVAADDGWRQQTEEHVAAIDALGVQHGLVVVTKTDLADPAPVHSDVGQRLATTSLAGSDVVTVSAQTGDGIRELAAALARMLSALPAADVEAPVRLWVDRAFTIRGAGAVVTGTLGAGELRVGDELQLAPGGRRVVVRGLQALKQPATAVPATARVAVNLRGVDHHDLHRGMALTTPDAWECARTVDVVTRADVEQCELTVHLGSAAVPARARRLGDRAVRLRLGSPLPMHLGDRLLLRDPARRTVVGADVVDVAPIPLRRRGDAARLARDLHHPISPDALLDRHQLLPLRRMQSWGMSTEPTTGHRVGDWWIASARWDSCRAAARAEVETEVGDRLSRGVAVERMRQRLDLPDLELVAAVVADCPELRMDNGHVVLTTATTPEIPELDALARRLTDGPVDAPDAEEVRSLDPGVLAHGVRTGALLHLGAGIYVAPHAPRWAVERLRALPQPFAVSDARQALGSSRRVVVPLLEHLDAARLTRKLPDGRRMVTPSRG